MAGQSTILLLSTALVVVLSQDPCSSGSHLCHADATCVSSSDLATSSCLCNEGFYGTGSSCDSCGEGQYSEFGSTESFECMCARGYTKANCPEISEYVVEDLSSLSASGRGPRFGWGSDFFAAPSASAASILDTTANVLVGDPDYSVVHASFFNSSDLTLVTGYEISDASVADSSFGYSIACYGASSWHCVVSAPDFDEGGSVDAGALFLIKHGSVDPMAPIPLFLPPEVVVSGGHVGTGLAVFLDRSNSTTNAVIVVGASGLDSGTGAVFLLNYQEEDYQWLSWVATANSSDVDIPEGCGLGSDVAVCDTDGIGFPEIVAGAPLADGGVGLVYIFYMAAGDGFQNRSLVVEDVLVIEPMSLTGVPTLSASLMPRFGTTVAAFGDFNADLRTDLVVGAPDAVVTGDVEARGELVLLFFGENNKTIEAAKEINVITEPQVARAFQNASETTLGTRVQSWGDVDGNGYDDLFTISDEVANVTGVIFLSESEKCCTPCQENSFKSTAGAEMCTKCPLNAESQAGSVACTCAEGFVSVDDVCVDARVTISIGGPNTQTMHGVTDSIYVVANLINVGEGVVTETMQWKWDTTWENEDCATDSPPSSSYSSLTVYRNTLLPLCDYRITANLLYLDLDGVTAASSAAIVVHVEQAPLVVVIAGGDQTVFYQPPNTLSLDGRASYDRDSPDAELRFLWSISPSPTSPIDADVWTEPVLLLPMDVLEPQAYTVTLHVEDMTLGDHNGTASVIVSLDTAVLHVGFDIISADGFQSSVNPNDVIRLQGYIISDDGYSLVEDDSLYAFSWEMECTCASTEEICVTLGDILVSDPARTSIAVNGEMLSGGAECRAAFRATLGQVGDDPSRHGLASRTFTVNSPPSMGNCTVSPRGGIGLLTQFTFSCAGWEDPDVEAGSPPGHGVQYQFGFVVADTFVPLSQWSAMSSFRTYLPPQRDGRSAIHFIVRIGDVHGGYRSEHLYPIVLMPEAICDLATNFIERTIPIKLVHGDLEQLLADEIAVSLSLSVFCEDPDNRLATGLISSVASSLVHIPCSEPASTRAAVILGAQFNRAESFDPEITELSFGCLRVVTECLLTQHKSSNATSVLVGDALATFFAHVSRNDISGEAERLLLQTLAWTVSFDVPGEFAKPLAMTVGQACCLAEDARENGALVVDYRRDCGDEFEDWNVIRIKLPEDLGDGVDYSREGWGSGVGSGLADALDPDNTEYLSVTHIATPPTILLVALRWKPGMHRSDVFSSSVTKTSAEYDGIGQANSDVVTFAIASNSTTFHHDFGHNSVEISLATYDDVTSDKCGNEVHTCSYYDVDANGWVEDGCHTEEANGDLVCVCSHLTDFLALLYSHDQYEHGYCVYDSHFEMFVSVGCLYLALMCLSMSQLWIMYRTPEETVTSVHWAINAHVLLLSCFRGVYLLVLSIADVSDLTYVIGMTLESVAYMLNFSAYGLIVFCMMKSLVVSKRITFRGRSILGPLKVFLVVADVLFLLVILGTLITYRIVHSNHYELAVAGQSILTSMCIILASGFAVFGRGVVHHLNQWGSNTSSGDSDKRQTRGRKIIFISVTYSVALLTQALMHLFAVIFVDAFIESFVVVMSFMYALEITCTLLLLWFYRHARALNLLTRSFMDDKRKKESGHMMMTRA
eukprot:Rmarinus@m.2041